MSLIDRTILEWAWMSEKGYPDINNENDLRVFESMFGFDLAEIYNRSKSVAAAQDFANSPDAKKINIKKFTSGKYANRINSSELKDFEQLKSLLSKHFDVPSEEIIYHAPGEGLASKDSVPGFQINTEEYGDVYISISTGKKGVGGLSSEAALAKGINDIKEFEETFTVKFTDGKRDAVIKGVSSAKQVGSKQEVEGAKADVALYDSSGTVIGNISVKEDGRTSSSFRWASVNNSKTPFRAAFVNKALKDESFPIDLKRTGHYLDTDASPKYQMFKQGTDERITMVVVEDAPTDANEDYLFGTDQPKTIIATRSFKESDFEFNENSKVLIINCSSLYTDISQIQDTEVEPAFIVTQHQKQTFGLDFRIVPQGMTNFGPKARGIRIKYTDVF